MRISSAHRPELDVLRFVAFLMVFLHHAGRQSGSSGFVVDACGFGLTLFFTLSAFLIGGRLLDEKVSTGTVSLRRFYARRALRIWPLYFTALGMFWAGTALHGSIEPDQASLLVALLTFTADFYYASGTHDWVGVVVDPLWSISMEEQFYLLFPPVVLLCGRRGIWCTCVAALAVAVATQAALAATGADRDVAIWTNPLVQIEFFALGTMMALWLRDGPLVLSTPTRVGLSLTALAVWSIAAWLTSIKQGGPAPLVLPLVLGYQMVALGCACLLLAFDGCTGRMPMMLERLGAMSFGLYVFHLWGLGLAGRLTGASSGIATLLLALATTTVMAAVSFKYLEQPFLRLKRLLVFERDHGGHPAMTAGVAS